MTNEYFSHEDIEAFLRNQMPEAQRTAFEAQMAKDPLLKQEVGFQQEMISAIRIHRQSALKSRLDAIEIPAAEPAFYTLPSFKWFAGALVASVASVGGYLYFQNNSQDFAPLTFRTEVAVIESPVTANLPAHFTEAAPEVQAPAESPTSTETTSLASTTAASRPTAATRSKAAKSSSISKARLAEASKILSSEAEFVVPEPGTANASTFTKDGNLTVPTGTIANAQVTEPLINVDVKIIADEDESFHYQHYNNKLFLYGSFGDQPYELLEVNTSDGKNLFMHYKGDFFKLESNALRKTPLVKIKDRKLISDLELLKRVK